LSSPKKTSWHYLLLISLLGLMAGSGLFFLLGNRGDAFADGSYIGEVPVGGLSPALAQQAVELYTQNTGMTLVVTGPDDYVKKLDLGAVGGQPDYKTSISKAWEQSLNSDWRTRLGWGQGEERRYPLLLTYKDQEVERWLEQTRFDVDRKPTEPRVVWEGEAMRVAEPESGRKLDADSLWAALPKSYQAGEYKLALKMDEVNAQVTTSELTGLVELASFSTAFNSGNVNRTVNLKKAATALNGTVVAPEGIFSFNDTVGPRDLANGYLEAMVIIKNEFTPGIGGGICQVSSTLYNAVLLSGFPLVERRNHSVAVGYVPVGLDATVAYPYQDFKFKNNADSAVYINAYARGDKMHVKLFGRRNNPISVKIERFVDQTTPFATVQKIDPTLGPGEEKVDHEGAEGYKVRTYRAIYDSQGLIRERKLISTDKYAPVNKLVLISTMAVVEGEEKPGMGEGTEPLPVEPGGGEVPSAVTPGTGENTLPEDMEPSEPVAEPVPADDGLPEDAAQM